MALAVAGRGDSYKERLAQKRGTDESSLGGGVAPALNRVSHHRSARVSNLSNLLYQQLLDTPSPTTRFNLPSLHLRSSSSLVYLGLPLPPLSLLNTLYVASHLFIDSLPQFRFFARQLDHPFVKPLQCYASATALVMASPYGLPCLDPSFPSLWLHRALLIKAPKVLLIEGASYVSGRRCQVGDAPNLAGGFHTAFLAWTRAFHPCGFIGPS
ncbi:hypothetical protein B0J12DRAFT_277889 [Macrophomina phaseolina]|uniref:Uncharacterized protein n=1 Tax=Macrophomina phaseolina TaxID=35725 RepID=A0ABQ8FXF8_9PEZI|nr:hypothetical protein B0J12DRAFT_277889 [Macrophomina phaseolina]